MATVTPFRAFHYNPKMFADFTSVITPPYDNIPIGEEKKYFSRSPYNFAYLDLPTQPDDDYQTSAKRLKEWFQKEILVETPQPVYFLYEQSFSAFGKNHTRRTLMASVLLHEFSERVILPHENTHGKYKTDRLNLMKATQSNLSQIFGMVKDGENFLNSVFDQWAFDTPFLKGKSDDGSTHVLWKIEENKAKEITSFFSDKPIYIVDGHHRYESSVQYAKELGVLGNPKHPAAYNLFAIANAFDPGLVVFPTHRLVKKGELKTFPLELLEKQFLLTPMEVSQLKIFVDTPTLTPQFGLYFQNKLYLCKPRDLSKSTTSVSKLSVTWSDETLLNEMGGIQKEERAKKLFYERDLQLAWENRDQYDLVIFQPNPLVTDVTDVADEKGFMPQKSTYFFPKLSAGICMRKLY